MDAQQVDLIVRLLAIVLSAYGVYSGYQQWKRGQLPVSQATARKTDAEATLANQQVTQSIATSASTLLTAGDVIVKNLIEQVAFLTQQVEKFSDEADKRERVIKDMQTQNEADKALIAQLLATIHGLNQQLADYQQGDL